MARRGCKINLNGTRSGSGSGNGSGKGSGNGSGNGNRNQKKCQGEVGNLKIEGENATRRVSSNSLSQLACSMCVSKGKWRGQRVESEE